MLTIFATPPASQVKEKEQIPQEVQIMPMADGIFGDEKLMGGG